MQSLTFTLGRLAVVLAGTLALGSCNRAEYALLPRSASYLGTATTTSKVRRVAVITPAVTPAAPALEAAPAVAREISVVSAPATAKSAPLATVPAETEVAQVIPAANQTVATAPPTKPKLNLVQRLALKKVAKKLDKVAARMPQLKQREASAARGGLDGNLRNAILFGAIGLILELLGGIAGIFYVIGTILIVIGLIFLLLWLLDQV